MEWCIYKHTNKINNKVYIGLTCRNTETRWRNGEGYKSQSKFYRAIKKYGWDNFNHEIIEKSISSLSKANKLEIYYIDKYKSTDKKYGYNVSKGGDGITMPSMPILQISSGIINRIIKQWDSVEDASKKTKISAALLYNVLNGRKCTAGGYYWCYKHKYNNWKPRKNEAIAFDDLEIELLKFLFNQGRSAKEIANQMQKPIRTIEYEMSKLKLIYKERWTKEDIDFIKTNYSNLGAKECSRRLNKSFDAVKIKASKLKIKSKDYHKNQMKPILCLENNTVYRSIAEASKILKLDSSSISKCCLGKQHSVHGMRFKYLDTNNSKQFKK